MTKGMGLLVRLHNAYAVHKNKYTDKIYRKVHIRLYNLLIEFFSDAFSPSQMKIFRFARTIDVSHLHKHVGGQQSVSLRSPVDANSICVVRLSVMYVVIGIINRNSNI